MKKTNVLYIGGSGRSGSTVLTKILNFWDGFIGLNEICYLWRYGLERNYPISNGELFNESTFWKEVLSRTYSGKAITQKEADFFSQPDQAGLKNILKNLSQQQHAAPETEDYALKLEKLYISIAEVSGADYIVDSSKTPDYAHFLSNIENLNIFFVHLVRDPRGVAYSWSKKFKRSDVQEDANVSMTSFNLVESTLRWIKWNVGCELIQRKKNVKYLRVRYEDFTTNPERVLKQITDFLGLKEEKPRYHLTEEGFHDHHNAPDISIWGNPQVRQSQGAIKVKEDKEWVEKFSFKKKLIVTLLTFPFLIRYRYPFF